jgi:hypothetical protein
MPDGMDTGAIFSHDRIYRYMLWREWDVKLPTCTFIGLNPSTADETIDDPTIRRCIGFAREWGYGRMQMLNLFAYRATDPLVMRLADDPIGPDNDRWLVEATRVSGLTVAAWGMHGVYRGRQQQVAELLRANRAGRVGAVQCLGTTKSGCPRHPLYLRASTQPVAWLPASR